MRGNRRNNKKNTKLVIPTYIQRKGSLRNQDATNKMKEIYQAISEIYSKNASKLSFQHLYTNGYQVVLHKYGDTLYADVQKRIKKYITGIREKIMKEVNSVFLESLLKKWNEHTTALAMVRDILMYLDRTYVPNKKKTPIFDLGIRLFGSQVFHKKCLDRILDCMMQIIHADRNGEAVASRFQLQNLCRMMISISKKDVYERYFEDRFLLESRRFFQTESSYFFAHNTSTAYLRKVLRRLKTERQRAKRCFHGTSIKKIENIVKSEMIDRYKRLIITKEGSGCEVMLKEWKLKDLKMVYDVLGLVEGALDPLLDLVLNHCKREGFAITKDKQRDSKPLTLVEDLIKLWDKYDKLLAKSFSKKEKRTHPSTSHPKGDDVMSQPQIVSQTQKRDRKFTQVVRKAFHDIVNDNERLPEYMSLYIDSKIRVGKHTVEESEFDIIFEQILRLFRHLREKDYFEKYYKIHLGKRLLGNKSQSQEAERSFVSKLKTEFGYQFTSKIEGMFMDMKLNSELTAGFKRHCMQTNFKGKTGYDLNVQVLTSGHWPIATNTGLTIQVPGYIQQGMEIFNNFYLNQHSGRKLTWKYSMGRADVKANGFARPFELSTSTLQMVVLDMFNQSKTLSFGKISDHTKIPQDNLKFQLRMLATKTKQHGRVILREKCSQLTSSTKFQANDKFKSQKIKVQIVHVKMKQDEEQFKQTHQKIDEERKWQLDACIVRIMKMRKKLEHRNLVMECTKQLQSRWLPNPDVIKRRIESLIEREYLERSKSDRAIYNYLA